jgi:hypothetical protein
MRRSTGTLALAGLLLLAGCGGFAGGGRSTDTVSPAPVPTDTPTASGSHWPPGTGPEGVTDPIELANAHYEALLDRSYTTTRTAVTREADGRLVSRTRFHGRFGPDRTRFRFVYTAEGESPVFETTPGRLELYADETRLLRSLTVRNETSRERLPPGSFSQRAGPFNERPGRAFGLRSPDREAYLLLSAVEGAVVPVAGDGAYRVRAAGIDQPVALETLERVEDPTNVSLTATLDANGLLRAYRLSYEATRDGQRLRVERTVSYSAVGNTTVERPAWAGDVVNGTA